MSLGRNWNEIALIGAPVGAGAGTAGCVLGPAALRIVDLRETLAALGHAVVDRGDVRPGTNSGGEAAKPAKSRARNFPEVAAFAEAVSAETFAALKKRQFPIIL